MKLCSHCGHSNAAHVDGMRCALCGCVPSRQTFVQEALPFRSTLSTGLPPRIAGNSRKKVS